MESAFLSIIVIPEMDARKPFKFLGFFKLGLYRHNSNAIHAVVVNMQYQYISPNMC